MNSSTTPIINIEEKYGNIPLGEALLVKG